MLTPGPRGFTNVTEMSFCSYHHGESLPSFSSLTFPIRNPSFSSIILKNISVVFNIRVRIFYTTAHIFYCPVLTFVLVIPSKDVDARFCTQAQRHPEVPHFPRTYLNVSKLFPFRNTSTPKQKMLLKHSPVELLQFERERRGVSGPSLNVALLCVQRFRGKKNRVSSFG